MGIAVVGSAAEEVHDEFSDVDMMYVREEMIPTEVIISIRSSWPESHFIYRSPDRLSQDVANGSITAWSISRGVVIHDPDEVIRSLFRQELSMPRREWMAERIQYVAGWPGDAEGLWRKTINFGILLLAKRGVVATTKHQLRKDFPHRIKHAMLCAAVALATVRPAVARDYSQEQITMLGEAAEVFHSELLLEE